METKNKLSEQDLDRVIEMAWEDRTPFDAIQMQFDLSEQEVIKLMRSHMKPSSFRLWRRRVQGRKTKHTALRNSDLDRFKSPMQRSITNNLISKR